MLESSLYMRNQLLRDTDWASMAHSLEVRVPLVDSKLLSQFARSPPEMDHNPSVCLRTVRAYHFRESVRTSEDRVYNPDPIVAAAGQSHPGVAASSCACCE